MCVCLFQHLNLCSGFLGHLVNSQGIIDTPGEAKKAEGLKEELASLNLTREKLDAMMKEFVDTAQVASEKDTYITKNARYPQEDTCVAHGWPKSSYVVSKIGWSALSRIQQREMEDDPRDDIVVSPVHLKPFELFVCGHSMFTGEPCAPWLGRN